MNNARKLYVVLQITSPLKYYSVQPMAIPMKWIFGHMAVFYTLYYSANPHSNPKMSMIFIIKSKIHYLKSLPILSTIPQTISSINVSKITLKNAHLLPNYSYLIISNVLPPNPSPFHHSHPFPNLIMSHKVYYRVIHRVIYRVIHIV
eukprot:NODE_243_length_11887_cov_0.520699.p10 type:complete len:147 gc:universal NODE_243_length_11887_cov_0.520699:6077-6517(+)